MRAKVAFHSHSHWGPQKVGFFSTKVHRALPSEKSGREKPLLAGGAHSGRFVWLIDLNLTAAGAFTWGQNTTIINQFMFDLVPSHSVMELMAANSRRRM